MKQKFLFTLLTLALCLMLLPTMALATDDDGYTAEGFCEAYGWTNGVLTKTGTCEHTDCNGYEPATLNGSVYQIGNAGQLYWFAAKVNGGSTTISAKLTADITINSGVLNSDGTPNTANSDFKQWTPIGNYDNEYCGTFDGDGKFISGLYYNGSDEYVGLFGYIGKDSDTDECGTVQNVTLKDSYLYSERSGDIYVGGIAGYNDSNGWISLSINSGKVSGKTESGECYIGGVAGYNSDGMVKNCYNTGDVSDNNSDTKDEVGVGGIVGENYNQGSVENCYNTGSVSSTTDGAMVGGIAGCNKDAYANSIKNCYYLQATGSNIDAVGNYNDYELTNVADKTAAEFASGEVAWLLNGETATPKYDYETLAWYQNLSTGGDAAPTLDSTHGKVYYGYAVGGCTKTYSNTALSDTPTHSWNSTTGKCSVCGVDCPHTTVTESNGAYTCHDCKQQMKVYAEDDGEVAPVNSAYFASIEASQSATAPGGSYYVVIKLLADCDENIEHGHGLSLDLNSHNLTSLKLDNKDTYDMTITDGSDDGAGAITTLKLTGTSGSVKLSGGSYGTITGADYVSLPDGYALRHTGENESGTDFVKHSEITGTLNNVKVVPCPHGVPNADGECEYCGSTVTVSVTHGTGTSATTAYYTTFNAAYDAAQSGDTVKLLADAAADKDIKKNLTIQLNGHELTGSLYIYSTVTIEGTGTVNWMRVDGTSADVTLKDGVTITTNVILTGGKLTVKNAKIEGTLHTGSGPDSGTLTMSGGSANELRVFPHSTVTLTGGTFGSISRMELVDEDNPTTSTNDYSQTPTFGAMLGEGCGFRTTGGTWYDKDNNNDATSLSNVEVKKLPIQGVSITADGTKPDGKDYYTYTYGNKIMLTANVTLAEGESATPTYQWTAINSSTELRTDDKLYLDALDATYDPAVGIIDETAGYGYQCVVTVDGYSLIAAVTFYVAKAALTAGTDYTAPTANTLTYDGKNHVLLSSGPIFPGCTMYYKLDNGEWSDIIIPTAKNAGTYTVYWYIDGGKNCQNVGSRENPAGTLTVTIDPKTVTPQVMVATGSTYDGTAKQPAVTVTVETDTANEGGLTSSITGTNDTLTKGTDYTVSYENNINAGENTAKVIVTAMQGSNYTWATPVEQTFSIAQAAARTLTDITVPLKYTVRTEQSVQIASSIMPADAGTLSYAKSSGDAITGISSWSVDSSTGEVKYTLDGTAAANTTITLPVVITSTNYADSTVNVKINLTAKDTPTPAANDITWTYTGSAVPATAITGTATFNGNDVAGTWSFTDPGASFVNVSDSSTSVGVTFTPTDGTNYSTVVTSIKVTINKATPTGTPTYTTITTGGKTLADAVLAIGTITPAGGSIAWNDPTDTVITANTAYGWTYTPADTDNYNTLTGSIKLYSVSTPSDLGGGGGGGGGGSAAATVTVPVSSDHASVEVKAEVNKGNATVEVSDKQVEQVIADGAGEVTLDVSGLKNVESATVPAHVVEKTNEAENTGLTVALPTGSVTLDETALESVTENANGKDVTVSVVSVPTTKLPTAVKDIIGMEPTVVAVVDVNVTVNGVKQSSFDGGRLTVSIPYTPKAGEDTSKLTVWFIRDDGTIENKGGYYDAAKKCFVFETEHLSQYLLVNTNELVSFTDVSADAWYAAAVNWAVSKDITGGIGEGKFGPDLSCTRAQLVTFLWRAAVAQGMDVSVGEDTNILSYTDALEIPEYAVSAFQWAVGAGIVQGYDGALMPNDDCTRGQIVTMLYRFAVAAGKDVSVGEDTNILSYADAFEVPEYAVAPFQWATGAGIVNGSDGKLMPSDTCTRGQIVTMLYRLLGE